MATKRTKKARIVGKYGVMSSLSKRNISSKRLSVVQCEDRLTNLPSCLITKILSYLPTKNAVATSILSRKWKRSWTSITNLDFDDNLSSYDFNFVRDIPTFRKFTTFVTRVVLLRERSCLHRFRLKCYCAYDDSLVNAWLMAVLQCNVQVLDISIRIKHPGLFPPDIFLCSTLMVLKLDACGSINMPISACLPGLRTLHIERVQLTDDVSFTNFLSGCPLLEELRLCRCGREDVCVMNIVAHVLKRLIIEDVTNNKCQIVIDTPALEYFDFNEYVEKIDVVKMDRLIEAKINFLYSELDDTFEILSEHITEFLNRISHVQNLVLPRDSSEIISLCNPALPKFSKLTYLELNASSDSEWMFLRKLLENSPCLETLKILQGSSELGKLMVNESLPFHNVPYCFLVHLKKVEIGTFEYFKDEMDLVKYILKNAKVLEKLILHYQRRYGYTAENDAKCFKELLSFPRASFICEVVICDS